MKHCISVPAVLLGRAQSQQESGTLEGEAGCVISWSSASSSKHLGDWSHSEAGVSGTVTTGVPKASCLQAATHTHTEGVFQYVHAHQVSSRRDGHSLPWSLPVSFTIPPLFPQTTLRLRHGKSRTAIKTPKERNQVVPGRASLLLRLSVLNAPGLAVLPLHSSSQRFCLV